MPNNVFNLTQQEDIVNEGKATQELNQLLDQLVANVTINGSGNPNGVVTGRLDQLYRDTTGGPPAMYVNTDGGTTWVGV